MRPFNPDAEDFLAEFDSLDDQEGNKLLFYWIKNRHSKLLEQLSRSRPELPFWSHCAGNPLLDEYKNLEDKTGYVYFLTDPDQVRNALAKWSMRDHRYSGEFILSIDDPVVHQRKRRTLVEKLQDPAMALKMDSAVELAWNSAIARTDFQHKAVDFDVLYFARNAALRFVAEYFGIPASVTTNEQGMAKWSSVAFREYIWKIHARHFVEDQPDSEAAINGISQIIQESFYTAPANSVIGRFRTDPGAFVTDQTDESGHYQKDVKAIGANILGCIQGLIDNVTTSACCALEQLVVRSSSSAKDNPLFSRDELLACASGKTNRTLEHYLFIAHQYNTPAPFLPRFADPKLDENLAKSELSGRHVSCAVGAAMNQIDHDSASRYDLDCRMGFGAHDCIGKYIGDKLATRIVRKILLAGHIDEAPLKKDWGWIVNNCRALYADGMTSEPRLNKSEGVLPAVYINADYAPEKQGEGAQLNTLLGTANDDIAYLTAKELSTVSPEMFSLFSPEQLVRLTANQIASFNYQQCKALYGIVQANQHINWSEEQQKALGKRISFFAVMKVTSTATARPHAYSLWSRDPDSVKVHDYVTWPGLIDKQFTARHLPPAPEKPALKPPPDAAFDSIDSHGEVTGLFKYDSNLTEKSRSSLLFPIFAQWLTDSFLRTDRVDRRKNRSNHQIDMCQIYGDSDDVSTTLRERTDGRMKIDELTDNIFPPRLFDPSGNVKAEFKQLPYVLDGHVNEVIGRWDEVISRKKNYLVSGLARGNATFGNAAMNTLFLREHNRVCGLLKKQYTHWNDEKLFQTARLIIILLELKIIISEYINHISAPADSDPRMSPGRIFRFDSSFAERQKWYRPNHISLEFNLLYRWHCLVPNAVYTGGKKYDLHQYVNFNDPLIEHGLDEVLVSASRQNIDEPALFTTPDILLRAEYEAIKMSRDYRVKPYNEYREHFGLKAFDSFEQLGCRDEVTAELERVYTNGIGSLDLLVGLYAERSDNGQVFGELMSAMVAHDAFTQALTNPLLSKNVLHKNTITPVGQQVLEETESLNDLWQRNRDSVSARPINGFNITMDYTE